ncbi:MAG: glycosyltransferase 87 family protein [Acetobacteraceae bacterium]
MRRLALFGAALIALTLVGLSLHRPGAITLPSLRVTQVFVGLMGVAGTVYMLAVREVLRRALPRSAVWLVLAVALVLRLTVLFVPPFLSSDVFRYVWDGKVQAAGINPYLYIPADPALAGLRDASIYPHIGRFDTAPTIYPPAAQIVFAMVARVSPTVLAMKTAMVLAEFVAMAAMLALLDAARLSRARLLIYAWNPLALWAFAGNGHVDALAIGFIGLALLARARLRDGWTGALLGAAILVKFLPGAIAPALWRRGDWRMPVACVAVIASLYAVYLGAGWHVLGYLPGYAAEEGIEQGSGFWLLAGVGEMTRITPSMTAAYVALGLCFLGALALWVGFRAPDEDADIVRVAEGAAILGGAAMLVLSPHYPWYFAWLALPCCLAPLRSVVYLSVAALLLYLNPLDERFLWASILYVPAIILAVLDVRRRWPRRAGTPMLERSA